MPVHRYDSALGAQAYDLATSVGPIGGPDVDGVWLPLARECGSPILELGCGTGRVLIPLARAGFEVTGLDSSAHMLAVAWRKLAEETAEVRERVTLVKGDMRDFDLHRRFALIICPFNTFQLLLAREDQERALRCARRALRSGGRFALSVFNPRLDLLTGGQWQSKPVVRKDPASGRTLETYHRTTYDGAGQMLECTFYQRLIEPGRAATRFETPLRMRYFFRFELELLLEKSGFIVQRLYGDYKGRRFRAGSPKMIPVARRITRGKGENLA